MSLLASPGEPPAGPNGTGFTAGEPWFDVDANCTEINVEAARADEASVRHHYRRLVDLRRDEDVLVSGEYDLLLPDDEQVYAYYPDARRRAGAGRARLVGRRRRGRPDRRGGVARGSQADGL